MKPVAGFTLLELIVASGIFALVALIGFATITDTSAIQTRTDAERLVGQSASFGLEAIAREIRLANGYQVVDPTLGTIVTQAPPFVIIGTAGHDQQITSSTVDIASTDFPTPSQAIPHVEEIALAQDPSTGHKFVELRACHDIGCTQIDSRSPLTPASVEVEDLTFTGLSNSPDRKPFVQITLTVTTPSGAKQSARQTVQTLVTPRNLTNSPAGGTP